MESPGRIVYRAQGNALTTRRDIVYRHEGVDLLMDVYAPEIAHAGKPLPAVLFVHGGPVPAETQPPKDWPFFQSYGELAATSGLIGVTFNHRFHHPLQFPDSKADVHAAIEFVRAHAAKFGIDAERIGLWVFSGGGPHVSWLLRDRPSYVRCLIAFYALLDLRHLAPRMRMLRRLRVSTKHRRQCTYATVRRTYRCLLRARVWTLRWSIGESTYSLKKPYQRMHS